MPSTAENIALLDRLIEDLARRKGPSESEAIDNMYDWLRDYAGFDAMQIHFVGEAIERAGLELTLGKCDE